MTSLPEWKVERPHHSTTCTRIEVPELDEDMAWLLGAIHGNGYIHLQEEVSKGAISIDFPSDYPERAIRAKRLIERFGVNAFIKLKKGERCETVRVASRELAEYFSSWLKKPKTDISIPDCILQSVPSVRSAYLAGLMDTDGALDNKPVKAVTTVYESFADQVMALYSSVGITTRKVITPRTEEKWQTLYEVSIINRKSVYNEKVAPHSCKGIIEKTQTRCSFSFPTVFLKNQIEPKVYCKTVATNAHSVPHDTFLRLGGSCAGVPIEIRSIEEGSIKPTWDIEVEGKHEFFVNGILSHNSATIGLFDADDEEMLCAKSGNWWEENGHRARANISAVLHREDPRFEEKLRRIVQACFDSNSGEPGLFLTNDYDYGTNPCQPAWATVLTPEGIKTFADITVGSTIWSGKQWTKVVNKWSTGVKPVYGFLTERGVFVGTANHRVVEYGKKIEVGSATHIDCFDDDVHWSMATEPKYTVASEITRQIYLGGHEVFDITVEDDEHVYWTGGCLVSNCGEISLKAFCNLTEVNVAACTNRHELIGAVNAATIIGTLQAAYTDFGYIAPDWKEIAEREALLGVSLTGQAMNWGLLSADNLQAAAQQSLYTNSKIASLIGINPAHRIGCTKPSGSTSAWLGVTSGIHAGHGKRYLRRVRVDITHPIARYLINNFGISAPESGDVIEFDKYNPSSIVITIPVEHDANDIILRDQESPLQLLDRVKHIHDHWIKPTHRQGPNTHNVSVTVSYKQEDKDQIVQWMIENKDHYAGLSLLPYDGHVYPQAPFEHVDDSKFSDYKEMFESCDFDLSKVDYSNYADERQGELACSGGGCEVT
jgi:hypothetical protein